MALLDMGTASASTIGNPTAGNYFIFLDSDNSDKLTKRDSTGVDVVIGGGSGLPNTTYDPVNKTLIVDGVKVALDNFIEVNSDFTLEKNSHISADTSSNEVRCKILFGTTSSFVVSDSKKKFDRDSFFIDVMNVDGVTVDHELELDKKDRTYVVYFDGTNWRYREEGKGEVKAVASVHIASEDFPPETLLGNITRIKEDSDNPERVVIETFNDDTEEWEEGEQVVDKVTMGDMEMTKYGDYSAIKIADNYYIHPSIKLDENNYLGSSCKVIIPNVNETDAVIQPFEANEFTGNYLIFYVAGSSDNVTHDFIGLSGSTTPTKAVNLFVYKGYRTEAEILNGLTPATAKAGRKALGKIHKSNIAKNKFSTGNVFNINLKDKLGFVKDAPYTVFLRTRDGSDFSLMGGDNVIPSPFGGNQPFVPKINTNRTLHKSIHITTELDADFDILAQEGLEEDTELRFASLQDALDKCAINGGGTVGVVGNHPAGSIIPATVDIKLIGIKNASIGDLTTWTSGSTKGLYQSSSSSTSSYTVENIKFINISDYGIRSKSSKEFNILNCDFINCGQDGSIVDPDNIAQNGLLGTDSTQSELSTAYGSSGFGGGTWRIQNSSKGFVTGNNVGVFGEPESACFRGMRFQDCGENGGYEVHGNCFYYTAEASIYLASSTYTEAKGCDNFNVYNNYVYAAAHSPILIIGGVNNKDYNNTYLNCWAYPAYWHVSEVQSENVVNGCGVQSHTFIGSSVESNLMGSRQRAGTKYILRNKNSVVNPKGLKEGFEIASNVGDTLQDKVNAIVELSMNIEGCDIAIKQTGANPNLTIIRNGNIFTNNLVNVQAPPTAYHVMSADDIHATLNNLDIQKDGDTLKLYEGVGGYIIGNPRQVKEIQAEASGLNIRIKIKGTRVILHDNIPVANCSKNGVLITGDQTVVLAEMNDLFNDTDSGGSAQATASLYWTYDISETNSDPTSGKIKTTGSKVYISKEATNTADLSALFSKVTTGNVIYIVQSNDDTRFLSAIINSQVDNTGWFAFDKTDSDEGNPFEDGEDLVIKIHTTGTSTVPFASQSANLYKWDDNSQYTNVELSDEFTYLGEQLDHDNRNLLVISNYRDLNSEGGYWMIGELNQAFIDAGDFSGTVSADTAWDDKIRFNPNQIFAENTLTHYTDGYDTVTGEAMESVNTLPLGLLYDRNDNKIKLLNLMDLPIVTEVMTETIAGDGNPRTLSIVGSSGTPVPSWELKRQYGSWYHPNGANAGNVYNGATFGTNNNPLELDTPIDEGFTAVWKHNVDNNGGGLYIGIWAGSTAQGNSNLKNSVYYELRLVCKQLSMWANDGDGWIDEQIDAVVLDSDMYIVWEHSPIDGKIRIYTFKDSSNRTLRKTSVIAFDSHTLYATTGSTGCELPIISFELFGAWDKIHRKSLGTTIQIKDGLLRDDVIKTKTPIQQGQKYSFNLSSVMSGNCFMGTFKDSNDISGIQSAYSFVNWIDQFKYDTYERLTDKGGWTLNASNSLYDVSNSWWQNDGTHRAVSIRNNSNGVVHIWDELLDELIATRDVDSIGEIYFFATASGTGGMTANDIPNPIIEYYPNTWFYKFGALSGQLVDDGEAYMDNDPHKDNQPFEYTKKLKRGWTAQFNVNTNDAQHIGVWNETEQNTHFSTGTSDNFWHVMYSFGYPGSGGTNEVRTDSDSHGSVATTVAENHPTGYALTTGDTFLFEYNDTDGRLYLYFFDDIDTYTLVGRSTEIFMSEELPLTLIGWHGTAFPIMTFQPSDI